MRSTTRLRQLLQDPGIIVAPGSYDCLTAKIIEREGFPAVYMTGAGTSAAKCGYPDLGLLTMTEMVANAANIVRSVDVPVIADGETGYGGVLNIARTVREYERAGVAAIHIEDQKHPNRIGFMENKEVIPIEQIPRNIHAALDARTDEDFAIIGRSDALSVTGWDDTLKRCETIVKAGADVLFVEAIETREQIEQLSREFDLPLMHNFVESPKAPLVPVADLEQLGYKIVIFSCTALLSVTKAFSHAMRELKEKGTTTHLMDSMADLDEACDIVGLSEMVEQEKQYLSGESNRH